ncbi:2-nonaprenyl-3-methyl-6-methoxy-1,4-benzoquinol hydroxylase [ANME-1 cluster archaeon GoMg1]|nr:2-nonaprenyl-3-methyl-6-methoxy-1,4-benzoquinol hydroxylase [ANME-1 cluster archaeon GoMg1]
MEKIVEVEEIIRLLNEDFVREIEATLIYVRNAFVMDQCDPSRVTEDIAIDEMRHMYWLADLIVKRGGKPSMEHKELEFGGDDLKSQLERQIALETEGIEKYKQQIDAINDAEVVGVLKHILDEEKRHRKEFRMRLERIDE